MRWMPEIGLKVVLAVLVLWVFQQGALYIPRNEEAPMYCDPFGYLRQARLFQQRGVLDGLDTRLENPAARLLVDTAKGLGLDVRTWADAVAPHCHHYNEATDRIIIQYPPGTGFLVSLFPQDLGERSLRLLSVACIAALSLLLIALAGQLAMAVAAGAAGALVMTQMVWGPATWSVAPSLVLAVAAAWLGARAFGGPRFGWRIVCAGLAGLLLGFAVNVRIPNVLLVAGYALILAALLWRAPGQRRAMVMLTATFAVTVAVGMIPTLLANHINAGSILSTTYGPADASLPTRRLGIIADNAERYFMGGWHSAMLVAAIAATAALLLFARVSRTPSAALAALAVTANLAVSVAFFLTHRIGIDYYLLPAAVWCTYGALFAWWSPGAGSPRILRARGVIGLVAAVAMIAAAFVVPIRKNNRFLDAEWSVDLPDGAVIWADLSTGMFVMERGLHAAKLIFAPPDTRNPMIERLQVLGVPQVFVEDSPTMTKEVIVPFLAEGRLVGIGKAHGFDAYLLTH